MRRSWKYPAARYRQEAISARVSPSMTATQAKVRPRTAKRSMRNTTTPIRTICSKI